MEIIGLIVRGETSAYTITVTSKGNVRCTCPAFRFSGPACKHITFALETLQSLQAHAREVGA